MQNPGTEGMLNQIAAASHKRPTRGAGIHPLGFQPAALSIGKQGNAADLKQRLRGQLPKSDPQERITAGPNGPRLQGTEAQAHHRAVTNT